MIEHTYSSFSVLIFLGHVQKLNLKMCCTCCGIIKALWPVKYTSLHPGDLATHWRSPASSDKAQGQAQGDTGCLRALLDVALNHGVWLTNPQVQERAIRVGNHLTS